MWETVTDLGHEITERLAVAGGWLYRTAFEHPRALGVPNVGGAAMTFVPGDSTQPGTALAVVPTEPEPKSDASEIRPSEAEPNA